jgi:hypothetical protein
MKKVQEVLSSVPHNSTEFYVGKGIPLAASPAGKGIAVDTDKARRCTGI